jgi:hypothetical protein
MARRILSAAVLAGMALSFSVPVAAELGVGADVVSRYVFRGALADDNVAVQPFLSATHEMGSGMLEIGAWGSYAVTSNAGGGSNENDLYVTYSTGPLAITFTDYYYATGTDAGSDFFSYSNDDQVHQLEIMGAYNQGALGISGAAIISGDPDTPIYVEASYTCTMDDDTSASLTAALGTETLYTSDGDPALINVGASVTSGDYTAAYILNPDVEQSWLVFSMSF